MVLIMFLILLTNSSTDMHVGRPEYPFPEKIVQKISIRLNLKNTPSISNISFSQFCTALKHFGEAISDIELVWQR